MVINKDQNSRRGQKGGRAVLLEEAIKTAMERTQKKGVDGWGLYTRNPRLEELGEWVEVAPPRGCFDPRCAHNSHDPAAPIVRWVPREGTLHYLGYDERDYEYYLLRLPGEDLYLRLRGEEFCHDRLELIDPSRVPEYLLVDYLKKKAFEQ